MHRLEQVPLQARQAFESLRFAVQYVNRPNLDFRGYAGTLASGEVKPGDRVQVLPGGQSSQVKSIVTFDGELQQARAGQAVTLTLEDEIDISRGDMLVHSQSEVRVSNRWSAHVVWMAQTPLAPGRIYDFKLGALSASGQISEIVHRIDINTLKTQAAQPLQLNEIGLCQVVLTKQAVVDRYQDNRNTGCFIMIDRLSNMTVAAGMIASILPADTALISDQPVAPAQRQARYQQQAVALHLLSDQADRLAQQLENQLFYRGHQALIVAAQDAATVVPYAQAMGLITLIVGPGDCPGAQRLEQTDLPSLLAYLNDQGYLIQ